jgi:preprotein translocase SecF subunit
MEKKQISFNKFYKLFNLVSIFLVLISIMLLFFKGLNYGVDFKGGTLIELRATDQQITIFQLRKSFLNMNLGDVNVKEFGKNNDFLIKFEKKESDNKNLISEIKENLNKSIGPGYNFRRVENVGPKVSAELLKSGVIAIGLSLVAMLIYIWIRFEWQFSLGAIQTLCV